MIALIVTTKMLWNIVSPPVRKCKGEWPQKGTKFTNVRFRSLCFLCLFVAFFFPSLLTSGRDLWNACVRWQNERRFSDENRFRWLDRHRFCNLDYFMPDADFSRGPICRSEGYTAPSQR